jgi:RES domain
VILYRVFPWDSNAADREAGGALFSPENRFGRFDNPELYRGLYCATTPAAAVGERLGFLAQWGSTSFREGSFELALATIETGNISISDLGHVNALAALKVERISEVATRDRRTTQLLAERIFRHEDAQGISWWSMYFADWMNVMLWDTNSIRVREEPELLSTASRHVIDAATALPRVIVA